MTPTQTLIAALMIAAAGMMAGWNLRSLCRDIATHRRDRSADANTLATIKIDFLADSAVHTSMVLDVDQLSTLAHSIGMHLVPMPTKRLQ